MARSKSDCYNTMLEESEHYYYGRIEISNAEQLKCFLDENKSWILEMMDWTEKVNNTKGDYVPSEGEICEMSRSLRNQTHNEQPWKNHAIESGQVITYDEMMEYFKMELSDSHDKVLSALMDAVESAERDGFVTLPSSVRSADDFVAWIKAQ
jgi:hypothetical protein